MKLLDSVALCKFLKKDSSLDAFLPGWWNQIHHISTPIVTRGVFDLGKVPSSWDSQQTRNKRGRWFLRTQLVHPIQR
jgi:hypothetical protein